MIQTKEHPKHPENGLATLHDSRAAMDKGGHVSAVNYADNSSSVNLNMEVWIIEE